MRLWTDAQLSPAIAAWLHRQFGIDAMAIRVMGLRDAEDLAIFTAAREANAVVMTKDSDFVDLVGRFGAPPQIVWLTCGNTSNTALCALLEREWPRVAALLAVGEPLVELRG